MFRPRIIPVLLLKNQGLVKTIKFKNPRYIGDPINAVKLFNDMKADELIFLDITAHSENRCISPEFIKMVGDEARMPFAAGGGIKSIGQIEQILKAGAERVVINSAAAELKGFIKNAADCFGSSTIAVAIDVKKKFLGKNQVFIKGAKVATGNDPVAYAKQMESEGAGELFVTGVENEGTMLGYDFELIKNISSAVTIPVIAHGGAGKFEHFRTAVNECHASAVAAGSRFVFHGPRNAVLVNYPSAEELNSIFI
ncbi:MAG: AglZ/HisF2 family acetamidino modification protein [Bacteroidia bacterium]